MGHDLAIVGGGPAGCATALLVAARRPGWRIIVLEALPAPVARACGEFVAPGGVAVLAQAGALAAVLATGATPIAGLRLSGGAGAAITRRFAPDHGLGVRRERFDAALQACAAEVVELRRGARLDALERDATGWRLGFGTGPEVSARIVVGADGRGSMVRRLAGLERPTRRTRFALACRARGIAHGRVGEMHLTAFGQVGLCPLGDGEVNLNLLLAPRSRALLRSRTPERLLQLAVGAAPGLRGRCTRLELGRVHATGSLPRCSRVAADGIALVGDAAGFCDPFTGEGIDLALAGAALLAARLGAEDDPAAALAGYARDWRRRIGRRHRLGEVLQALLARRPVAHAALRALAAQGSLARSLMHR